MTLLRWPLNPKRRRGSSPSIITAGLLGYWPLNDSGPLVRDFSGKGNNGTASGSALATRASVPLVLLGNVSSRYFNGSSGSILTTLLDAANDWTLCGWANPSSFLNTNYIGNVIINSDKSGQFGIGMGITNSALHYLFPNSSSQSFSFSFTVNQWYHLVVVFSRTLNKIFGYVNGRPIGVASVSFATPASFAAFNLGASGVASGGSNTNFFTGLLSDVRAYNRVLSPGEITRIASGSG